MVWKLAFIPEVKSWFQYPWTSCTAKLVVLLLAGFVGE
jgi:hypothetical protein